MVFTTPFDSTVLDEADKVHEQLRQAAWRARFRQHYLSFHDAKGGDSNERGGCPLCG